MLWIWIGMTILAFVIEAITVSFASLMVGFGAVLSFVAGLFDWSPVAQIVLFFSSSILFLLTLKPLIKKHFNQKVSKTNVDALIEERGIVTQSISNLEQKGEVKLKGLCYRARNEENDEVISEGEQVSVVRIEGVTVYVKRKNA